MHKVRNLLDKEQNEVKILFTSVTKCHRHFNRCPNKLKCHPTQVSCGPAFTHTELNQLDSAHHPTMGGGHQPSMGGHQPSMGGASAKYGGVINQLWGGISQVWGGSSTNYGGAISQVWGGSSTNYGGPSTNYGGASAKYGGGGIFPPLCTGSQNPQNYFSNTYVLPSVNRTAGPMRHCYD